MTSPKIRPPSLFLAALLTLSAGCSARMQLDPQLVARAPEQPVVPYRTVPLHDERGEWIVNYVFNQDYMAWVSQGAVAPRDIERLGESDAGVILFRRLLRQQMELVLDGGEPMNTFRDRAENVCIEPPVEHKKFGAGGPPTYFPMEAGDSHARADIQAAATRPQPAFEDHRELDPQPLTTPALCLPKFLAPLVAIDLAEEPIIQLVKDVVDRLNSLGLQSMFHQGMNGPVSQ